LRPKAFDPRIPVYLQVLQAFQRALARGDLTPGGRAPAVRDLATQLLVNPNTVQRAYQQLEAEGLLFSRRGLGTFVAADAEALNRLRERLADAAVAAYLDEMSALGFSKKAAIARLTRVRQPVSTEGGE
jgi:DNA-binding transcriptional regulator YhcF (GntR family)